jgi:hypothetical protein
VFIAIIVDFTLLAADDASVKDAAMMPHVQA